MVTTIPTVRYFEKIIVAKTRQGFGWSQYLLNIISVYLYLAPTSSAGLIFFMVLIFYCYQPCGILSERNVKTRAHDMGFFLIDLRLGSFSIL